MSNIAVSVIVPVYQVKPYLAECIHSLLKQDFPLRYEIILSDFGSTDGSSDICEEYERKYPGRIYRIRWKDNYGVSASRNVGLMAATGEYITFVDSDDIVRKNYLSELYQTAKKGNYQIVTSGYYIYKGIPFIGYSRSRFVGTGKDCLKKIYQSPSLKFRTFCWGRLYERKFLLDHHLTFNTNYDRFEDWLFIFQCLFFAENVCYVPKPLYYYRQRKGSAMSSAKEILTPHLSVLASTKDFALNNDYDTAKALFDKPHFAIRAQVFYDCYVSHRYFHQSLFGLYRDSKDRLKEIFDMKKRETTLE
jgi:glycosyltransferase involved in cell wall biosynthesis